MSNISIKNLSVHYDGYCALKGLDFEACKGEFVAIVGKSGSGKTTFLHALARLVEFSGDISAPKNVGMVFQHYAVFPWFTASENIAFGLDNETKEKRAQIVRKHLKLAKLEDKKDKYPAELSGGQVQRIALARSLAHNPEVLLMDEPYGALDAYTRDKMQQWLLDIWTTHKKTIVFVTHNIEEAIFLSDRILVLNDKKFVGEYKISFARPRNESIKFSPEFNKLRQQIFESLNHSNN
ncbi:ABC transporter ATP-binding protein [Patescibacteria group bacterium]|nr:ABC transporter ATP-binding protein [Patescibacteria group bacterium]MBU4016095.1 ABC transporter ATP-binding protein [Patescibacteria group bacterium]MBU4098690.1 ABC transporter ATP-binding protein [Patescibacteria group bacterium]